MKDTLGGSDRVKAFDDYASNYDQWFDSPEGKAVFMAEVEAVSLLTKGLEHPFLEIGVGTGRFAKELGVDFGIDPSVKMLIMAATRGIKTKKAEGEALPFPDDSFGAVFILFTICFVRDPGKVINEAKRVLKRGGGLIIGFINSESPWGEFYAKKQAEGHPIYKHARFFSIDEIVDLISTAGFTYLASSSALTQLPATSQCEDDAYDGIVSNSGFICILARKQGSGE